MPLDNTRQKPGGDETRRRGAYFLTDAPPDFPRQFLLAAGGTLCMMATVESKFFRRQGQDWRLDQKTQSPFMKILLQHVRTKLYVRGLGNWTPNPGEAHDFQHSQRAIDFAREHGLTSVQIAVKFIDAQFDEVFPLPSIATVAPQRVHA